MIIMRKSGRIGAATLGRMTLGRKAFGKMTFGRMTLSRTANYQNVIQLKGIRQNGI